ncbi:MAG: hypothetical protein A2806_00695 [Candidatus Terrybacteria bacterium RIFCSPHIGHO2_01_FULL_48_17]|uniref:Transglycosylase SLT domain-containing protein n=1 Tax=Candidatus Terrybacteria bacterium RIFCSPHIGHO2_01_FULL_48_17 TaxID=1802362 RepID=A0A1G2PKK2_9BACT|nr:MAG: hypothetical protein A2806_00695 [Candidatus Terrybacteria bacterium RIFCSPHIGHO2_01_FULL_48_17]OHA53857.1 MAG: hypothetical protein A3A30_01295 [Candidatus Terrybacteria bacterium RIFCSPLOWO2_01_FULL_48_14]
MTFSKILFRVSFLALTLFFVGAFVFFSLDAQAQQDKIELKQNLEQIDQEILTLRSTIQELQSRAATLEDELFLLAQQIKQTELEIERIQKDIGLLDEKITALQASITQREQNIDQKKKAMAFFLRELNAYDAVPPLIRIAGSPTLQNIFLETTALEQSQEKLILGIEDIREETQALLQERGLLEEKRGQQEELLRIAELAEEDLRVKQFNRETLIAETKGSETAFRRLVSQKTQQAISIRTALYLLEDIGAKLQFGEAYTIAQQYAQKTNVRAAFLLAVLQKESRLGARVGTGNWQTDMHPRDWPAFMAITAELGLDPNQTPVSKKPSYGWGGAMGPAQFLPSTWLSWESRISELTGHNPPSPWNVEDSLAAAALKLAAAGADQQTFENEWKAAMIYFAGSNWDNPAFAFYGDSVMALSHQFEEQIKILEAETSR